MSNPSETVDKAAMQLAVVNPSSALTMPQEEFIEFYCQPIQDDTWIRHEDIVKMEDMIETEGGEAIKKEILKEYIEEHVRTGQTAPPDPILEGMLMQEQFMREYQQNERRADHSKADTYREILVSRYRRSNPKPEHPPAPFGEEEVNVDSDDGEEAKVDDAAQPEDQSQPEAASEATGQEAEDAAPQTAEAEECPADSATATAPATAPAADADPDADGDASGKAAPIASSPKAADNVAVEEDASAAANPRAHADEM